MKKLMMIALCALAAKVALAAVAPESDFNFSNGIITGYNGSGGEVEIPSTIGGVPVTSIGNGVFYGRSGLTSVTIPKGVTSIGASAFSGCRGLTGELSIPAKVETVTVAGGVVLLGVTVNTNGNFTAETKD